MKDTRELIIDASLQVFTDKGYTSATTLEISKKAGVSEMTLFRQFQTKNNLFLITVKQAMGQSVITDLNVDMDTDFKVFITNLLDKKIRLISSNISLIKMLIRESLSKTLPAELEFTKLISSQVINQIKTYIKRHNLAIDSQSFADLVVGLLLRYAIIEETPRYHLLDQTEKTIYLNNYLNILKI